jgi:hypothetical protein
MVLFLKIEEGIDGQNERQWDHHILLFLELLLFPIGLPIAQEELEPIK